MMSGLKLPRVQTEYSILFWMKLTWSDSDILVVRLNMVSPTDFTKRFKPPPLNAAVSLARGNYCAKNKNWSTLNRKWKYRESHSRGVINLKIEYYLGVTWHNTVYLKLNITKKWEFQQEIDKYHISL